MHELLDAGFYHEHEAGGMIPILLDVLDGRVPSETLDLSVPARPEEAGLCSAAPDIPAHVAADGGGIGGVCYIFGGRAGLKHRDLFGEAAEGHRLDVALCRLAAALIQRLCSDAAGSCEPARCENSTTSVSACTVSVPLGHASQPPQ